jgi:hypothetical protein
MSDNFENVKEFILKQIPIQVNKRLSKNIFFQGASVEILAEVTTEQMLIQLRVYVLGRAVRTEVVDTIKYPATWKDAFKERYYTDWMKKKFPVKYTEVDVEVNHYHICPHIDSRMSENDLHLKWLEGKEE